MTNPTPEINKLGLTPDDLKFMNNPALTALARHIHAAHAEEPEDTEPASDVTMGEEQ